MSPPPATGARLAAAYGAAGFSILIWGATPAATWVAAAEIDPLTTGVLRTVMAAAAALPAALVARLPWPANGDDWLLLLTSAAAGFIVFPLLFNVAVPMTSTSHAALVISSAPVFTGSFGALRERRMPSRRWWAGVALALAGEALLIGSRSGVEGRPSSLLGDLMCLVAIIIAAAGYESGSRLAARIGTWSTTFWAIAVAGVIQLPLLAVIAPRTEWAAVSAFGWSAMVYLAAGSTILGYVGWYWALAMGGVVRMAPLQFAQPLVALVLGALAFAEAMTITVLVSAAAIVGGIAIARKP